MTRTIVLPVNGQSNPMFTLIDPNGEDLHKHLMELNRAHADEEVRKNTGEALVSELERIRDNIEETNGVTRREMEEVEATSGAALESYPITAFTERRSSTGVQVALEAIDIRQGATIVAIIVGSLGLLYKIIKWLTGRAKSEAGGSGGGGTGGSFKGKTDEEYKKEIEKLEEDIAASEADRAKFDVEGKLDAEGKKKLDQDIATYLDRRNVFIEHCISGNPTYSKAFANFIPAFMDRYAKERDLLESVIEKLKDVADNSSEEVTEQDLNAIKAISASLDDSGFSMHKWEPYQVFLNACGVRSGGTKTLKESTAELMDKFRKEIEKPSKMRAQEIKANGFKRVNDDRRAIIGCLDDQEDSGGTHGNIFYIPGDELEKGVDELDKIADEIKKIGEAFTQRQDKKYSASSIKALMAMQEVLAKLNGRTTLINFGIMINEMLGKEILKFIDESKKFAKQYLVIGH